MLHDFSPAPAVVMKTLSIEGARFLPISMENENSQLAAAQAGEHGEDGGQLRHRLPHDIWHESNRLYLSMCSRPGW